MLESYIKIKFIEECIGIVITILIMFGAFFFFLFSHSIDNWKARQDKKSEKFWKEHKDE